MLRLLSALSVVTALLASVGAGAAERTATLAVDGMTCASCPYIVRTALSKVPGVSKAEVSLADRKAVVSFDDTKTTATALAQAASAAGFPSRVLDE